jgi:hypothetical protein
MIISHKHKFIFLHSRKCAGSSMEVALNNYLGPDDIQIGSWTETMRRDGKMNNKAIKDAFFSPLSWGVSLKQIAASVLSGKGINLPRVVNSSIKRYYNEKLGDNPACATAESVMNFDPSAWKNYFKFSFVRNPFDFEISDYFWRTKGIDQGLGFKEFLKKKLKITEDHKGIVPFPSTNWSIYSINNEVVLDYIGTFEKLNEHVSLIGKRIGLPLDIRSFPKVKSAILKPSNIKDFYDNESIEMVNTLHKNELNYFGYTYPY